MATITSSAVLTKAVTAASTAASASSTVRATPQGGVLEGGNPSVYDPKNPIILFIIQVRPYIPQRGVAPHCTALRIIYESECPFTAPRRLDQRWKLTMFITAGWYYYHLLPNPALPSFQAPPASGHS